MAQSVRELAQEALLMCGQGSAKSIVDLANRYPKAEVWTLALGAMRRNKPDRSPLHYLERALVTGAEQLQAIASIAAERPPSERWSGPLLERLLADRIHRKLHAFPAFPITETDTAATPQDAADIRQAWMQWDRDELERAERVLFALLDEQPEPRRSDEPRPCTETERDPYAARVADWRALYTEAKATYELAHRAVQFRAEYV